MSAFQVLIWSDTQWHTTKYTQQVDLMGNKSLQVQSIFSDTIYNHSLTVNVDNLIVLNSREINLEANISKYTNR